jgi:hypothetical protein
MGLRLVGFSDPADRMRLLDYLGQGHLQRAA